MKKIISLFSNYKRHSAAAVLVFVMLTTLIMPLQVHALDWKWMCWYMTGQNKTDCESQINTTVDVSGAIINGAIDATVGTFYLGIASILLAISNTIFFFAGWLIDLILPYFTADLSHNDGVIAGWGTFRDITNLFFIFIMLAISIATILRLESYGAKALLARLVMVALLINFSLPIAKTIIDVNNVVASVFYEQLTASVDGGPKKVSEKINKLTGMATVFSGETIKSMQDAETQANNFSIGTIFLGISAILIVSSFVFLAFAILLIIRNIYLGFLIMLSPLAFLGMVLPYTQGYAKQWWEKLIKQSLIAPVGFMMLYAAINILSKLSAAGFSTTSGRDMGGAFIGQSDQFPMIYNFMIVIGVLIGALVVTQSLGAMGASTAIAWGQGAYKGAKGFAGKHTYGRAATAIEQKYGEKLRAASPTVGGWAADQFKRVGGEYKKTAEAKVGAVASMKDAGRQAQAMSNLSEAERAAVWKKLSQQQKAGMQSVTATNPAYAGMIKGLADKEEKERQKKVGERAGVAITKEIKKGETAKTYQDVPGVSSSLPLEGLFRQLTSIEKSSSAGAPDVAAIQKLAGELSIFGKDLTAVERTLIANNSTTAADIVHSLSPGDKTLINAALGAQREFKEQKGGGGEKPDSTGAPKH